MQIKWDKALRKTAILPVFLLCSCYFPHLAKTGQDYEGPRKAKSEVVTLNEGTFKSNPQNVIEKLWFADIIKVDGKPWPKGIDRLELLPGDHILTMTCYYPYGNKGKGFRGQSDHTYTFKAGDHWYPWATLNVSLYSRVTGDILGGVCGNTLERNDPDL